MTTPSWNGRRALVTGAGGFIGSRLVEKLVERGADVRAFVRYTSNAGWGWLDKSPVRDDIHVVAGDITDPEGVRAAVAGTSVVFHLAASIGIPRSFEAPRDTFRVNVEGTLNVLQAVRAESGVERVVHTSTSEVYGTPAETPIRETHPLIAQSPYAASKIAADKLVESFHRAFNLPVVTLRPFNTFGPRQSLRAVLPTIIAQALARSEIRLGALHPQRDLTFVDDTVAGFIAAAEAAGVAGEVVQLGTGRATSVADLAALVKKIVGRDVPVVTEGDRARPHKSEIDLLVSDPAKAKALLAWTPQHTLERGVEETVRWFRDERVADAQKDWTYRV